MGGSGSKQSSSSTAQSSSSTAPSPPPPTPPLPEPWRQTGRRGKPMKWDEETEKNLRETCLDKGDIPLARNQKVRILMLGATGSGKSSFLNSLYNALTEKIVPWSYTAASSTTVTKTLHNPRLRIGGKAPYFKIMDAPGILEADEQFYTDFVTMVLDGHIKEDAELPSGGIPKDLDYYVEEPDLLDSPCLVVFVVKAGGYIPDSVLKRKFDIVQKRAADNKVKVAVVLTKADILSQGEKFPLKDKNVKYMYNSEAAREAVKIARQETGLPENQIFPITNYTDQTEICTEMNVALLYTLSKLLEIANAAAESRLPVDDD